MLRIGDFSQLAQVSVPTLRHYDELGLLKPAHVDKFTDYRYYTVEQLPRLNRILALKDLGLSLEQIRHLLKDDVPVAQLRGMLTMKQAEIEQQIEHERVRLARVEARLRQIEHEGEAAPYDVVLKRVEAFAIAGVRGIVPHVSMMPDLRFPALRRLYDFLSDWRVPRAEPELMLYHNAEYSDDDIDMEAAVALDKGALKALAGVEASEHGISLRTLAAVERMASTIHHGRLVDIPQAIIAIFAWIGRNGYRSAGPIREIHLYGREFDITDDPADWNAPRVMEIQVPVEPE